MKMNNECLIVIDRDGTIIEKKDYLGRNNNWKKEIKILDKTIFLLKSLYIIFPDNLKIVFTNQTGVALGYFTEERVKEVNQYINNILLKNKIIIDEWIYSPEADRKYAESKGIQNLYVKDKSSRKPNPKLLIEFLLKNGLNLKSFKTIIVIGDREEDRKLSKNIGGLFINID
jgi:histidinol-phosphate phosphatase family protein